MRGNGLGQGMNAAARYALCVTLACSILSYMDRQVISLLVTPIKQSLGLSDVQIGLLQGLAFTLCYAAAGIPLAFAVDRANRVRVGSACVACWSIATTACGLVSGYPGLLLARASTAVSEAGFSPAALSLLSDKVPPSRIARVSALFLLGPPLGTGFALLVGGLLLSVLKAHGGLDLPLLGRLEPWQGLFAIIGLPGLFLSLLLLITVREPARTRAAIAREGPGERSGYFFGELRKVGDFIFPYVTGTVLIMLVQFAYAAWAPTFFVRVWKVEPQRVGALLGPIFIVMSILGALTSGFLAKGTDSSSTLRRIVVIVLMGGTLLVVAATAMPYATTLRSTLVVYGLVAFSCSVVAPLATAPLLLIMPSELRGRSLASGGALLAIVAAGGGPLAVGLVTDHVLGNEQEVGHALSIVSVSSAVVGLLVVARARRALLRGWPGEGTRGAIPIAADD